MTGSPLNYDSTDDSRKPAVPSTRNRGRPNYILLLIALGVTAVIVIAVVLVFSFGQQQNEKAQHDLTVNQVLFDETCRHQALQMDTGIFIDNYKKCILNNGIMP